MRAIKKEDLASINYYQVPKWLMELFIKKAISQGAFKTYVLMYDRVRLSASNGWIDENGDVYIKYSYDEMQKDLSCSRQSISDNLKDLVKCGLIDKKKCFSSSTIFYLNVSSLENLTSKENLDCQSSRKLDYSSLENLDSNKNNINKNNINKNNKIDTSVEVSPDQSKVEFKNNFCNYIALVSEATNTELEKVRMTIYPSTFSNINIVEVLEEIKKSKFLRGELERKPKLTNFSRINMIKKIIAGEYADNEEQQNKITNKIKRNVKESDDELDSLIEELGL